MKGGSEYFFAIYFRVLESVVVCVFVVRVSPGILWGPIKAVEATNFF